MPLGKLSFYILSYFTKMKSNPAQKIQSNVSQVKRSPHQGPKLTLTNSQNVSDFDKLRVTKISTSKLLRVGIIHVSHTFGKNLLVVSPVC